MDNAHATDWKRYHDRRFRVVRVLDGDTFDLDAPDSDKDKNVTCVRLLGVDTPEVKEDMHFSREAAEFAERTLMGRNVHVVLSSMETRGKYERLLAYVFLERGGRMFNEMLLEEGYAYADLRFDHHYYKRFEAIDKGARKAGVGLWANVTLDKMPPWKQRFERQGDVPCQEDRLEKLGHVRSRLETTIAPAEPHESMDTIRRQTRRALRHAIVMREVLGPPLALCPSDQQL